MKKEPEEESDSDEQSKENNTSEGNVSEGVTENDAKETQVETVEDAVSESVEKQTAESKEENIDETSEESLSEDVTEKETLENNAENATEDTPKETIDETSEEVLLVDDRTVSEKLEDKIYKIVDTIADKCENIEKTIEDLEDKIANIKRIVSHYVDLISNERTQSLLKRLFKEIGGIFVHIAPKKLNANLHIGMDNPATTGQICMYASMLYPIYKDNIQIEPDFEEKVLEGTFYLKGRIRLGHFVAMAIRLVVNKDFWYVITHIKPKEDKKAKQTQESKRPQEGGKINQNQDNKNKES